MSNLLSSCSVRCSGRSTGLRRADAVRVAVDGTRLHYEVFGRRRAPAVLMIQGLGADKHGWDMQRFILAGQYYVIAFDNRGAGVSDKPLGAYSMEQMTDDAVAVLDAVDVDAAHVIGASMGGVIGQIMAVRYPERVLSLTLACTACRDHPWRRELMERWMETALERGMGAMTKQAARWVMAPRSFRRLAPTFGWLGPLAMTSTCAFVCLAGTRRSWRPTTAWPRSWATSTCRPSSSSATKTSSRHAATAKRSPNASRAPSSS